MRTICWATELMKTLVFEFRIVTFEYFMHEMSIPEAYFCFNNLQYTDFNFKTMLRYQIWSLYNSNGFGKNKNKITDIMELPWDNEGKKHVIATKEELKMQKERLKRAEELIKNSEIKETKFM